ncbi:hypothetical protein EBS43_09050, partial [bacterium]|nr:hypothetical protein [bacterium]
TAVTGDRVIVTDEALRHVIEEHFRGIPQDIILETIERVLRDPTDLFRDSRDQSKEYDFFYRLESGDFIVAIVKIIPGGAYLSSLYPTGKKHRNKHKKFKRVKL